jgi:hypothetical protein
MQAAHKLLPWALDRSSRALRHLPRAPTHVRPVPARCTSAHMHHPNAIEVAGHVQACSGCAFPRLTVEPLTDALQNVREFSLNNER